MLKIEKPPVACVAERAEATIRKPDLGPGPKPGVYVRLEEGFKPAGADDTPWDDSGYSPIHDTPERPFP